MCVSVFLQTLFLFTCIQFVSVFTASANNLNQNLQPPPLKKNNGLSLTDVLLLDLVEVPFCVFVVVVVFFFLYSEVLSLKSLPFLLKYNFSHCFFGICHSTLPLTAYQRPLCGHN